MKLTAYTDGAYDKETNRCGFGIEFADEDGNGLNSCYGGFALGELVAFRALVNLLSEGAA